MKVKLARILYFIDGCTPTEEDVEAASQIAGNVVFRNALFVSNNDSLETCDGVAGNVPAIYEERFSSAQAAIQENVKKLKKTAPKIADEKPVKVLSEQEPETGIPAWKATEK